MRGQEVSLRQTLGAVPTRGPGTGWNDQLGPRGAKTSVPGEQSPTIARPEGVLGEA